MNHLAPWIREAFRNGKVREANGAVRIHRIGEYYYANVVWLAVIGKLGLAAALILSQKLAGQTLQAVWDTVARELGVSLDNCNQLSSAHAETGMTAPAMADRLEAGWTPDATHNIVMEPDGDELDQREPAAEQEDFYEDD